MEYPDRILVGLSPYQKLYLLQNDQLLIQFDNEIDEEGIQKFLRENNLKDRSVSRNTASMRAANLKWVILPPNTSSSQFSHILNSRRANITMVAPIYYEDRQGSESAASPIPNTVVIKFKPETEKKMIDYLTKQFELAYNQIMSDSLKPFHYFNLSYHEDKPGKSVFDIIENLQMLEDIELVEYDWFKLETYLFIPNDVFWASQWDMIRISTPDAWNIQQGISTVWIAMIDSGFDLTHPDLAFTPNTAPTFTHFNAEQAIAGNPPPYNAGPSGVPHGTCVAGLAGATLNNAAGVAGVAGACTIMPVRLGTIPSADRVAAGINWAASRGARVASMSLGTAPTATLITALNNAWAAGMVLCAATGNDGENTTSPPISFPATHANVIGVGASDQADQRKRPASADGECWGSQFGPESGVMAPGVLCWTTDEQGASGYNNSGGATTNWACVNYPSTGDATGNYFALFDGTSAATPHVGGLAALLFSQYSLTNQQVRDIIERTCDKVNPAMYPYVDDPGHPNGIWHQETGYGRINTFHALDFADVFIKDWSGDTGTEPSSPSGGDFWDFSDIVIRPTDDDVFIPNYPDQASNVERGQTNYLYIRVTNNGPRAARNVVVDARIAPYAGTEFFYPTDWTSTDLTHIKPTLVTPLSTIPSGGSAIAKFTISSAQVEELWGWETGHTWHPCLLALVTADNDYAFTSSTIVGSGVIVRRNNIAQRNLSVVDYLAGSSYSFPFIAGNQHNNGRVMELVIDRSKIPDDLDVFLSIDDDYSAFPVLNLNKPILYEQDSEKRIVFLERTRLEMTLGCCRGIVTLEKGSSFDCKTSVNIENNTIKGGIEMTLKDNKRFLKIIDPVSVIRIKKQPKQVYPFSLLINIPENAEKGREYRITIAQRNQKGITVGGVTLVSTIK
jgi:subtilase family protein